MKPTLMRGLAAAAVACTLLLPGAAMARDERRVEVWAQPGFVRQWFTGDVGRVSTGSVGFQLSQGFRYGPVGFSVTLLTDYRLTRQQPPPYGSGLQTFGVALGPRALFSLDQLDFIAGVDYASIGIVGNPLTALMGRDPRYHAAGGAASARYFVARPIYVDVGITTRYLFAADSPTFDVGLSLSLGLATTPK